MASNIPDCGTCKALEICKPSFVWCCECETGFCNDCEKRHKAVMTTKAHQTTPIDKHDQLQLNVLKISQLCPDHNEQYHSYCEVHERPCCVNCIIQSHKTCKNLLPIQNVIGGIKTSNVLRECEENLTEIHENISSIILDRQQNLSTLKNERKRIESEIRETKQKVIRHLDFIETELLQHTSRLEESEKSKIQSLILSLEKEEKEINDMKADLTAIKEHASELQVFIALKNVEQQSSTKRTKINELFSSKRLIHSHLSLDLNRTLKSVGKNIPTFGHVSLDSGSCNVVLKKTKEKQAQLHVPKVKSIESVEIELVKSIDIRVEKKYLWGFCFLQDGRFAVPSDGDECIVMMTKDGTLECEIDTKPYDVVDIALIPSTNTLAATTGSDGKHCINIIDISRRKIVTSIQSDTKNYGITYKDGYLIYCAESLGIFKMNLNDEKITTVKKIVNMSSFCSIASHRDNLYYTNKDSNTITSCSKDGTTQWEFKYQNVLYWPRGISVDKYGNVYVIGSGTQNLLLISHDGLRHRELLSGKNGLSFPVALDFDGKNNRLLFTNQHKKAFLYKINYA